MDIMRTLYMRGACLKAIPMNTPTIFAAASPINGKTFLVVERCLFFLKCKPSVIEATVLWITIAIMRLIRFSKCESNPTAIPSNSEWKIRANVQMKEAK